MSRYRFTRGWAHGLVVCGFVVLTLAVLIAVGAAFMPLDRLAPRVANYQPPIQITLRVLGVCAVLVAGLIVAGAFIVGGQLLLIFLDQRALLAGICREVRRQRPEVSEPARRRL
jgi:hypothetical protein